MREVAFYSSPICCARRLLPQEVIGKSTFYTRRGDENENYTGEWLTGFGGLALNGAEHLRFFRTKLYDNEQ